MLVKLVNVGPKPYTLTHAMHEPQGFTIVPGGERICHLEVALVHFGNPGAVNAGPAKADRKRDAELERIQVLWGYYGGLMSDSAWNGAGLDKLSGDSIGPLCPQIECYDLENNRMWMVHDDPLGVNRSGAVDQRILDVT